MARSICHNAMPVYSFVSGHRSRRWQDLKDYRSQVEIVVNEPGGGNQIMGGPVAWA